MAPPDWNTWAQQLFSGAFGAVLGAGISWFTTYTASQQAERRQRKTVRRQLLLILRSARGRFEAARTSPAFPIADDDPATGILLRLSFTPEVALALSDREANIVQQAALRAERVARGTSNNRDASSSVVPDDQKHRIISQGCESVVMLIDKALIALGEES